MKLLVTAAWIFFGIDAVLVVMLLVTRNMGDDAAGRGMATGFGLVLTPVVLAVGALLFWATRTGSKAGVIAGFVIAGIPFWMLARNFIGDFSSGLSRSIRDQRRLHYAQPVLTDIARALRAGDASRVRELAGGATLDFSARNSMDLTILGFAVNQVLSNGPTEANVAGVQALLAAGARPDADILGPDKELLEYMLGGNTPEARETLRLLLQAGADPNATDKQEQRPLLFSTYLDLPELEILAAHGADLAVVDSRGDRPGWNGLMHMAYSQQWDMARFLLERGVPDDHRTPTGESLDTILAALREDGIYDTAGYQAFTAALAAKRAGRAPQGR